MNISIVTLSQQLRVPADDLRSVAYVELTATEFDDVSDTVSDDGARKLREHFMGGVDPH